MIASGDQNQLPSSFTPLIDLLKTLMFFSNLNGFNSSPLPPVQGSTQRKGSSKVWKEKGTKWFCHFFSLPFVLFFIFCFALLVCFALLFWVSLVLCIALFNFFFFLFVVYFVFHIKIKIKIENYKNSVYVYIGICLPWMAIETKFSKLCIFCNLDEHLYAQLSKWVLWLVFVMSKIKWSLILNTRITLFDGKD